MINFSTLHLSAWGKKKVIAEKQISNHNLQITNEIGKRRKGKGERLTANNKSQIPNQKHDR